MRADDETELIHDKPDTASDTIIQLRRAVINPLPDREVISVRGRMIKCIAPTGKLHLVYQRSNPPSPISVWLAVTPKTAGNISLQAVVNDRYSVTWQQFVYP